MSNQPESKFGPGVAKFTHAATEKELLWIFVIGGIVKYELDAPVNPSPLAHFPVHQVDLLFNRRRRRQAPGYVSKSPCVILRIKRPMVQGRARNLPAPTRKLPPKPAPPAIAAVQIASKLPYSSP